MTYEELRRGFRWGIPERYNIAADTVDRHATARPDGLALVFEDESGAILRLTFADVRHASNRLANALKANGLVAGDRVAILLPQTSETAIAHLATYRSGLIAVPLFVLFGPDAIEYRLADSNAVAPRHRCVELAESRGDPRPAPESPDCHRRRWRWRRWDARLREAGGRRVDGLPDGRDVC